jgi:serine/threonine-protein kinase RsbW
MSDSQEKTETENETAEKFTLTVKSNLKNLTKISEFINKAMQHYNIHNVKDTYAVQLSVDEACTNIIKHAYNNNSEGIIVISCVFLDKKFVVNIMDWGESFDPTTMPKPDTESCLNERKEGGLGIFFMKKFMDEISYTRCNDMNLLTITKYLTNIPT